MKHVQRRRLLDKARRKGEAHIVDVIAPMLDRRFKWLKRDLRRQNLRKRLAKNNGALVKADDEDWDSWGDAFSEALQSALVDSVVFVEGVESDYFSSIGYDVVGLDPRQVVEAYQERVGLQITHISDDTLAAVQEQITAWFQTDAALPELISSLEALFSPYRAELIATTEMGFIASQVALEQMKNLGIEGWWWDAIMDGATCDICSGLMIEQNSGKPFEIGDAMPPDASHPHCRCGVLYAEPGETAPAEAE